MKNSQFTHIKELALFLLVLHVTSSKATTCRDTWPYCPSLRSICATQFVRQNCRLTCNNCPPNPCITNNGGCEHLCNWTGTEALCRCHAGFALREDRRTCRDIDECNEMPNPCASGLPIHCVNTVGSYSCEVHSCTESGTMNYYRSQECCRITNSTCGLTATITQRLQRLRQDGMSRIFGGTPVTVTTWPWQAQILYRGSHHCGATLISDQWLIGAAHCFRRHSFRSMAVYLGHVRGAHLTHIETSTREQRTIAQVVIAEDYDIFHNDIALIRFDFPVPINDFIRPICLPCGETPSVGDKCWATGFGRTESSGSAAANTLLEVDVPVIDAEACSRAYRGVYPIDPNQMMCAGYQQGGKDACVGDSGGPLACQRSNSCEWYLSGVTSFGRACGLPGFYGVYTKVAHYERWIRETVGENVTTLCERSRTPCTGLANVDSDCYAKLDRCESFPHYMETNCRLACCQLRNNDISNCHDDPTFKQMCQTYSNQCNNRVFHSILRERCRKTCNFC